MGATGTPGEETRKLNRRNTHTEKTSDPVSRPLGVHPTRPLTRRGDSRIQADLHRESFPRLSVVSCTNRGFPRRLDGGLDGRLGVNDHLNLPMGGH